MKLPSVRSLALVSGILGGAATVTVALGASAVTSPIVLRAGSDRSRLTIPVEIGGVSAPCVLDTGTSTMLVSPALARFAGLARGPAVDEIAPDGRAYRDRSTHLHHFRVGGIALHGLPALISSKLGGLQALCGYDFFAHIPVLIDRDRQRVTLFPPASAYAQLQCLAVDLSMHVPVGSAVINDTLLPGIVYDSGMIGGGALWRGAAARLAQPVALPPASAPAASGLHCGAAATAGFTRGGPSVGIDLCLADRRPDGQNGILETNLPTVHAIAVDYPHHRVCFALGAPSGITSIPPTDALDQNAWTRLNAQHPIPAATPTP